MKDYLDLGILALAIVVACCGFIARVRAYRPLIWGGAVLATLTALHRRPGNGLAILLFGEHSAALPAEFFGNVWWVLGAWLVKGVLDIFFRRTLFPHDGQPHARRLFADLIFIVVYLVAFFGIIDTVFKQSISAVLASHRKQANRCINGSAAGRSSRALSANCPTSKLLSETFWQKERSLAVREDDATVNQGCWSTTQSTSSRLTSPRKRQRS